MRFLLYISILLLMASCAKVEQQSIIIDTIPQGAAITVTETDNKTGLTFDRKLGISPVEYEISHKKVSADSSGPVKLDDYGNFTDGSSGTKVVSEFKYLFKATKTGYFLEEVGISDFDTLYESGKLEIKLDKSPLWWETETCVATNEWINLTVNPEISDNEMWQRLVASVTKRYKDLKEYDFNSGYLATPFKMRSFNTSRGTFLLRSKFTATVMERDPLTYRLTLASEWSNVEGKVWHPYPRVFKEDAELITELMNRFQSY